MRRAVRTTRPTISPRLAIRILSKSGLPAAVDAKRGAMAAPRLGCHRSARCTEDVARASMMPGSVCEPGLMRREPIHCRRESFVVGRARAAGRNDPIFCPLALNESPRVPKVCFALLESPPFEALLHVRACALGKGGACSRRQLRPQAKLLPGRLGASRRSAKVPTARSAPHECARVVTPRRLQRGDCIHALDQVSSDANPGETSEHTKRNPTHLAAQHSPTRAARNFVHGLNRPPPPPSRQPWWR